MKNFNQARNQAGFSLIELLLVLAIIAALAVAAFIVYPRVQAGRNASYESQVLSSAQAGVKALFTTNNYAKLTKAVAFNAEVFPDNMNLSSTSIQNQWGGEVAISGSTNAAVASATSPARHFLITYTNVPTDVCIRLAGAAVQNFGGVFVDPANGGAVTNVVQNSFAATPVPLNEANITTGCKGGTGGQASITLLSN